MRAWLHKTCEKHSEVDQEGEEEEDGKRKLSTSLARSLFLKLSLRLLPPPLLLLSSTSVSLSRPPRPARSLSQSRGAFERKTIIQGRHTGWLDSCWLWGSAQPLSRGMRWREREWRREEREDLPLPLCYEQVSGETLSSEPTGALFICCTCRIEMGITATLLWDCVLCTVISACINDCSVQRAAAGFSFVSFAWISLGSPPCVWRCLLMCHLWVLFELTIGLNLVKYGLPLSSTAKRRFKYRV